MNNNKSSTIQVKNLYQLKWDVINLVWSKYLVSKQRDILIPAKHLETDGRLKSEIEEVLKGFKCFSYSHRGTRNYLVKDIQEEALKVAYKELRGLYERFIQFAEEEFYFAFSKDYKLKINLKDATIKINETKRNLDVKNKAVRFLLLLIQKEGSVLTDWETVFEMNLEPKDELMETDTDAFYITKYLKRDLIKYLKELGVPSDVINKSLLRVESLGYKLLPFN